MTVCLIPRCDGMGWGVGNFNLVVGLQGSKLGRIRLKEEQSKGKHCGHISFSMADTS